MGIWIRSIIGAFAQLSHSIEDSDDFADSPTHDKLDALAQQLGYHIQYHPSDDDLPTISFGREGKIKAEALFPDSFMPVSSIITPEDFATNDEIEEARIALESYLASLPEEYKAVKELKWTQTEEFLYTY